MPRVKLVAFLQFLFVFVKRSCMSRVVGVPTGFLETVYNGKVSVVWIVKVSRVVDIYNGLIGRSRSGGVGRVE
jgi:hypothetical protein